MDSNKVQKWIDFLKSLKKEELPYLAVALDTYNGIINVVDHGDRIAGLQIYLNEEVRSHVFRVNPQEGWVEYYTANEYEPGKFEYEVYEGKPVIKRDYGHVKIK